MFEIRLWYIFQIDFQRSKNITDRSISVVGCSWTPSVFKPIFICSRNDLMFQWDVWLSKKIVDHSRAFVAVEEKHWYPTVLCCSWKSLFFKGCFYLFTKVDGMKIVDFLFVHEVQRMFFILIVSSLFLFLFVSNDVFIVHEHRWF